MTSSSSFIAPSPRQQLKPIALPSCGYSPLYFARCFLSFELCLGSALHLSTAHHNGRGRQERPGEGGNP